MFKSCPPYPLLPSVTEQVDRDSQPIFGELADATPPYKTHCDALGKNHLPQSDQSF